MLPHQTVKTTQPSPFQSQGELGSANLRILDATVLQQSMNLVCTYNKCLWFSLGTHRNQNFPLELSPLLLLGCRKQTLSPLPYFNLQIIFSGLLGNLLNFKGGSLNSSYKKHQQDTDTYCVSCHTPRICLTCILSASKS
jgi:hypothetical protein